MDILLFTHFSDKTTIIRKSKLLADNVSLTRLCVRFDKIRDLRDSVAHANRFAQTEAEEKAVSRTVRDIATYRTLIKDAAHRLASRK